MQTRTRVHPQKHVCDHVVPKGYSLAKHHMQILLSLKIMHTIPFSIDPLICMQIFDTFRFLKYA